MPSPKRPTDRDFNSFEFKPGVLRFPHWEGVNKEGSTIYPSSNQLRDAINIRPVHGGYVSRGGLTKAASTQATGAIDGFFDAGDIGAVS